MPCAPVRIPIKDDENNNHTYSSMNMMKEKLAKQKVKHRDSIDEEIDADSSKCCNIQ